MGLLESPPVKAIFVNYVVSIALAHNGVTIFNGSKLILVVGFRAVVPSLGMAQFGFSLMVKVVFFDC